MKIYVAEMPKRARDCPFVKEYTSGSITAPHCGLCRVEDPCCSYDFQECSLTEYDETYTDKLKQPRCNCLVLMEERNR